MPAPMTMTVFFAPAPCSAPLATPAIAPPLALIMSRRFIADQHNSDLPGDKIGVNMNTLISRRKAIGAFAASAMPAASYSRILGANDRIQIGLLGVGHRSAGHREMLKQTAQTDSKFDLRSVCDLWSVNRDR